MALLPLRCCRESAWNRSLHKKQISRLFTIAATRKNARSRRQTSPEERRPDYFCWRRRCLTDGRRNHYRGFRNLRTPAPQVAIRPYPIPFLHQPNRLAKRFDTYFSKKFSAPPCGGEQDGHAVVQPRRYLISIRMNQAKSAAPLGEERRLGCLLLVTLTLLRRYVVAGPPADPKDMPPSAWTACLPPGLL